jgi:hypothetical protein
MASLSNVSSRVSSSVSSAKSTATSAIAFSDENENAIDGKREIQREKVAKKSNFYRFLISFLYYAIVNILIFVVLIGSPMLYIVKLAKTGFFPTDANVFPYTDKPNDKMPSPVDLNVMKDRKFGGFGIWTSPESVYSQKAMFDQSAYANSLSKGFIGFLNNLGDTKNDSSLGLYFSNTLKQIIASLFWAMNVMFYYFNYLPDWFVMLLFGGFGFGFGGILNIFGYGIGGIISIVLPAIIFGIISGLLSTFTVLIGIFYHILNLKDIFKNVVSQGVFSREEVWENNKDITFFRMITSPIQFLKMLFVIFFCFPVSISISPIIALLHNFITAIFQTTYKTKGSNETFSFKNFMIDNFVYKKTFLLLLLCYGLVMNSFNHLGIQYGVGSLIAILLLAFSTGAFKNGPPTSPTLTPGIIK